MLPEGNRAGNINRFLGFEDEYDRYRPAAPQTAVDLLTMYLGGRPALVVDIGCGTGLSTFVWRERADRVVGVEPNGDMRGKALDKLARAEGAGHISFVPGFSNQLDMVESGSADIITCSQSFHWMEPMSTLQEAARALRDGGVFAAYDCDWPPTVDWRVEEAYMRLTDHADALVVRLMDEREQPKKADKSKHLQHLRDSGVFRYTKEVVFHNAEPCDAERYVGLALSQGSVQSAFKLGAKELDADIDAFRRLAAAHFNGRTLDVLFSYRMRLGVK